MIGSGRRTPSVRRVARRRKRLRWSWSLCEGSVSDRSQGSRTNGTPISRTLSIRGETPADAGQLPWIPTPAPRHVAKTPTREASEGTPRHNICNMDTAGIEPRTRNALLMAAQPLAVRIGIMPSCRALGVSRATFYRRRRSTPGHQQPRPTPARALCEAEREQVLDVLASPRFVDPAPAEVVPTLLDEGQYLCSERTMYPVQAIMASAVAFVAPRGRGQRSPPSARSSTSRPAVGRYAVTAVLGSSQTSTVIAEVNVGEGTSLICWWRAPEQSRKSSSPASRSPRAGTTSPIRCVAMCRMSTIHRIPACTTPQTGSTRGCTTNPW